MALAIESKGDLTLTAEDVARLPCPGNLSPSSIAWSTDDSIITFLHSSGQMTRELWAMRPPTQAGSPAEAWKFVTPPNEGDTEENLSLEEKLRRERQRIHDVGVTSYSWCGQAAVCSRVLVPLQGHLYVRNGMDEEAPLRMVYDKSKHGPAVDPQLSPDGLLVAFVANGEIYCVSVAVDVAAEEPAVRLTFGAREIDGVSNGLADFVAQEEMDRYRGFWWAPDSKKIAFTQVDERHIPEYRTQHQGKDTVEDEGHHYPFAGGVNPIVRLGVVGVELGDSKEMQDDASALGVTPEGPTTTTNSTDPMWMDLGDDDVYLARVHWFPDGSLGVEVESRDQLELRLVRIDTDTGSVEVLLEEKSAVWINLHHLFRCLAAPVPPPPSASGSSAPPSFSFAWGSERSGFMHLYLYTYVPGFTGGAVLIGALTAGEWIVESIAGIDQTRSMIYYTGTATSALERHLYASPLLAQAHSTPPPPLQLTAGEGMHSVTMDHANQRFVDVVSTLSSPPRMLLFAFSPTAAAQASLVHEVQQAPDPRVGALGARLAPPEMFSISTRDGGDTLFGALYRPDPGEYGTGPFPTVVSVYGGPRVQRVNRSWAQAVDMRAQYLRSKGLAVIKCDNRGSSRRGLAFEATLKGRMGTLEVGDQEDAVHWAVSQGVADPARVGIYGWSYGGYLSAMSLCKAPGTFACAIAGAPVSSWDGYDTHYTERYMSTPQRNPEGYRNSSVSTHVESMQGRLLLVHGLVDENVHFRHTARLINALIAARKNYDLLLFPDERHSPRRLRDRIYMEQRIADFITENLVNKFVV